MEVEYIRVENGSVLFSTLGEDAILCAVLFRIPGTSVAFVGGGNIRFRKPRNKRIGSWTFGEKRFYVSKLPDFLHYRVLWRQQLSSGIIDKINSRYALLQNT